ncbi:hypothetical protein V8F44DRAFT_488466 [Aspergillus fumigatus]
MACRSRVPRLVVAEEPETADPSDIDLGVMDQSSERCQSVGELYANLRQFKDNSIIMQKALTQEGQPITVNISTYKHLHGWEALQASNEMSHSSTRRWHIINKAFNTVAEVVARMVTVTHFRCYQRLAVAPIKEITDCYNEGSRLQELNQKLEAWATRKAQQLHYVQLAATVMLAVDAQCLSWPTENRHWMGRAFWYWCIVLDVFSIGISSQQLSILQYIQACNLDHSPLLGMIVKENSEGKYPDSNMVYVWECPMMLDPGFGVDSKEIACIVRQLFAGLFAMTYEL